MRITIEGGTPQELAANLAEVLLRGWRDWDNDRNTSIEERAQKIVEKKLDEAVSRGVESAVAEYTTARARSVVDETLSKGIERTNDYGSVQRVQPWDEFVREQLVKDRYSNDKLTRLARESVEKLFKTELKGLLEQLAKQVRDQVDEMIGSKIKEAIRGAVGIKS